MGIYRRSMRATSRMSLAELERSNDQMEIALMIAGFFTFGLTWICLYFILREEEALLHK